MFATRHLVLAVCLLGPLAAAQRAAAQAVLHLDPSVASTGRAGTTVSVFWDDAPDYWANPALLALYDGVYFEHSRTAFYPEQATNVRYTTNRYAAGHNGLAIALQGQPFAPGTGSRFNWGLSSVIGEDGTLLGYYTPHEKVESWSVAVRLEVLADAFLRRAGSSAPSLQPYVDFAIGMSSKIDSVNRWPSWASPSRNYGNGDLTSTDYGALLRVTPINRLARPNGEGPSLGGMRVDVAAGASLRRDDYDPNFPLVFDTPTHVFQRGASVHATLGLPRALFRALPSCPAFVRRSLAELAALGVAAQWTRTAYSSGESGRPADIGPAYEAPVDRSRSVGGDLTVCNLLTLRWGDGDRGVPHSWGWGISVPLGSVGTFRFDRAAAPYGSAYAPITHRTSFVVRVDPFAVARLLDGER